MNDEAPTLPAADDGLRMLAMRLFEQALDRPSGERRPFIEAETRANAALNAAALALLDAHAASNGFLEPLPETTREIGAYRLIEPIGRGGVGRVWLAERRDDHRTGAYIPFQFPQPKNVDRVQVISSTFWPKSDAFALDS